MASSSDITLIGGGIIGLLTAREFADAGASVTVIDKSEIGKEASWAGGGILMPLYPWRQHPAITQLVLPGLSMYAALATELAQKTGIDPEWQPCGMLITENPDLETAMAWCERNGIKHEPADMALLKELGVTPKQPLWLPKVAQIRNPRLVKALKQDLLQRGVQLLENCAITDIGLVNNRVNSLRNNGKTLSISQLILCTGAWTAELMSRFFPVVGRNSPAISPIKGQMLLFAAKPGILKPIVLHGDQYLIPRLDGHILAGSTVESATFDKSTTPEALDQIKAFAYQLLPALNCCPVVKQWAGIRPGTPYGIPYIDKHPEIDNLSINAGHFRNGLAMAPASAHLLADLILNRPPIIDPEPYRLDIPA